MNNRLALLLMAGMLVHGTLWNSTACSADPVFSGPQVGEKLPPLRVKVIAGAGEGEVLDVVAEAGDKPQLIFFLHERTRPAFGLMNTVMRFAKTRMKDGLQPVHVFLSDDATETEAWLKRLNASMFASGIRRTLSLDGVEGPGAYGLNRNVTVTVLVANEGKVTANFALVQPGEQADAPRIFAAVVDVLGGGPVPDVAEFSQQSMMRLAPLDRRLQPLLRQLAEPDISQEDVEAVVARIDAVLKETPAARAGLGAAAERYASGAAFKNLNPAAQAAIRKWLPPRRDDRPQEVNLRPLLVPLIQKTATPEQVQKAAEAIEQRIAEDRAARATLARITKTIVDAGKVDNYGTPAAQEYLRKWARDLNAER